MSKLVYCPEEGIFIHEFEATGEYVCPPDEMTCCHFIESAPPQKCQGHGGYKNPYGVRVDMYYCENRVCQDPLIAHRHVHPISTSKYWLCFFKEGKADTYWGFDPNNDFANKRRVELVQKR